MARHSCDGAGLLAAFRAAVANLEAHVEEINSLNVYPVPDGDTGSNMLATVRAALAEAEATTETSAERVGAAISFGALMGARGNSGVITSQIFRGMAEGLGGKRHYNALDLAHSLTLGAQTAYGAVGKPVEGTILTVVREAASAAVTAAERENDLETVLTAVVEASEAAVARTPSLLPILREAGVVDAGGQGLYRLLQGALLYLAGQAPVTAGREPTAPRASTLVAHADAGFGYETMFLLQPHPGQALDIDAIREHLESVGDSVLVAGDPRALKVHVHSERPDEIIGFGLSLGTLSRISVENLDGQARDVQERRARDFASGPGAGDPQGARPDRDARATAEPAADAGADRNRERAATIATAPRAAGAATATGAVPEAGAMHPARIVDGVGRNGQARADLGLPSSSRTISARPSLAVVAVAAGDGLAAVFESFGVASIVRGGQRENPSTGELLAAVDGVDADEIILLPNNPNVVLAARQVAGMSRNRVCVVPTRNAAEGVAALLALDPSLDATANTGPMTEAGRAVQTLLVTEAVRDAKIAGRKVKHGHTIVLDPDDGLVAAAGDRDRALVAALDTLRPGFELVTLYYGEGADLAEAEAVSRLLTSWRSDIEVELVHGGQPHYRYLIAAE